MPGTNGMPIDTSCAACGAHLRIPRKLIRAGEPITCVKCGSPIALPGQAEEASPELPPPLPSAEALTSPACEFCDVQLRRFQFLQDAVKVCPRCGKQLIPDVPGPAKTAPAKPPAAVERPAPMPAAPTPAAPAPRLISPLQRLALTESDDLVFKPRGPAAAESEDSLPDQRLALLPVATVAAFLCGSFGLLVVSIPSLSMLSRPLCGVGLLISVGALLVAWRTQRPVLAPGAVVALCIFGVIVTAPADPARGRQLPLEMPVPEGPLQAPPEGAR